MGATIQRTKLSSKTNRILTDESHAPANAADVRVISGIDILSNNQVRREFTLMQGLRMKMVLNRLTWCRLLSPLLRWDT